MNKVKGLLSSGAVLLFGVLLSGCASGAGKSMPYDSWFLGFGAPAYMEVWIETAQVVDIQKQVFRGAGAGGSA